MIVVIAVISKVWIAPTMIVRHVVAATPVFVVEPLVPRDPQTFLQARMAQIMHGFCGRQ